MEINKKDLVVVSDFDGTITKKDSNDLLFKKLGGGANQKIEERFIAGEI